MSFERQMRIILDDDASEAERIAAVEVLRATKPVAAVLPLALQLPRVEDQLKAAIREALIEMDGPATIAMDLESDDDDVRIRAAESLALIPAPSGVAPLLRALADPVARVRELAASALGLYADRSAVAPLCTLLASDPDPDVRSAAAQSLGHLSGGVALEALEMAYDRDPDDFARILIGEALTRIRESVTA